MRSILHVILISIVAFSCHGVRIGDEALVPQADDQDLYDGVTASKGEHQAAASPKEADVLRRVEPRRPRSSRGSDEAFPQSLAEAKHRVFKALGLKEDQTPSLWAMITAPDAMLVIAFATLCTLGFLNIMLSDVVTAKKREEVRQQHISLYQTYGIEAGRLIEHLEHMVADSTTLAERNFQEKQRSMQKSLSDILKDQNPMLSEPKATLADLYRRWFLAWLRTFGQCSLDPVGTPKHICSEVELRSAGSVKAMSGLMLKRLKDAPVQFITEDLDHASQMLEGQSIRRKTGRRKGFRASDCCFCCGSCCCSWVACAFGCGITSRREQDDAEPFPVDVSVVCLKITLLSWAHIRMITGLFIGLGLAAFYSVTQQFVLAGIAGVAVLLLIVLLFCVEGIDERHRLEKEVKQLEEKGIGLRCLAENPVDSAWAARRPPLPPAPARLHPEAVAGRSAADKLAAVRAAMTRAGADVLVVSALDEVAYLLNLRGGDVARTPVVLAYALVEADSATLFVDEAKLPEDVRSFLASSGVAVQPYAEALSAVSSLAERGKRVWLDPERTNFALYAALGAAGPRVRKPSPLADMKAVKNASELDGMRAAHRRDGAALAASFAKLEARVRSGARVSEVDVDEEVTQRRAGQRGYLDNSFDTIAGYGPNAAIIHYRAEPASAALLGTAAPLLLDSGAQYVDGTTDVTRTMHFGEPSAHVRECFTRVLKGHIALATAVFPEGTPGFVVDAFARRPLWEVGLDYRHGTGHGVGAALAVHEGPQRIAHEFENKTPLRAGMIVSNEPGYYSDGEFGIRIENLLVVVVKNTPHSFGDRKYLGFEPLTLVPIQRELMSMELLDDKEVAYLDAYHVRVREEVLPVLEKQPGEEYEAARHWLLRATEPLLAPGSGVGAGARRAALRGGAA